MQITTMCIIYRCGDMEDPLTDSDRSRPTSTPSYNTRFATNPPESVLPA